jgi:hypothetical protein
VFKEEHSERGSLELKLEEQKIQAHKASAEKRRDYGKAPSTEGGV